MRPSSIFVAPIRWYQRTISPGLPRRCRYVPTCSQYAIDSLRVHGVVKGTILSVWRLLRCNPWSRGGVDRVPPPGKWPTKPLGHDELLDLYEQEDNARNSS
ncbi:membrane protein insertion efficiency factor YidD [Arcanobacterium haemolyticum]|nr:membrane protein insertion efficiency factor YidD [Arcanobacterium haemolyticum]